MLSWHQDDTGDFTVAMTTKGIAMDCHMTKHCGPVERLDDFHDSYTPWENYFHRENILFWNIVE